MEAAEDRAVEEMYQRLRSFQLRFVYRGDLPHGDLFHGRRQKAAAKDEAEQHAAGRYLGKDLQGLYISSMPHANSRHADNLPSNRSSVLLVSA